MALVGVSSTAHTAERELYYSGWDNALVLLTHV